MLGKSTVVASIAVFVFPAIANAGSTYEFRNESPNSDVADFDDDGYPDLAVGHFDGRTSMGCAAGEGQVDIYYMDTDFTYPGSPDESWYVDLSGITGNGACGDAFGASITTGDFNNDGYHDLAIGAPESTVGTLSEAGQVYVIPGSASGLTSTGSLVFTQDTTNIEGVAEANDHFGTTLAGGDFDNDGYDDIAIGVMGEDSDAGYVNVIYGSSGGLAATDDQLWSQNSTGVIDSAEAGDRFAKALAAGDLDNDGYDDLVVGVPGEDVSTVTEAGVINIIYGSSTGLTGTDSQLWWQNSTNIEDTAETNDEFGSELACIDKNDDGYDDVSIAVPGEGAERAIQVIFGSASGTTSSGDTITLGNPTHTALAWITFACQNDCVHCPPEIGCSACHTKCTWFTFWEPD